MAQYTLAALTLPKGTSSPMPSARTLPQAVTDHADCQIDRRDLLAGLAGFVASALALDTAHAGSPIAADVIETIAPDHVKKLAERFAAREFVKPKVDAVEPFNNLTAEQYRDIRFRAEQATWRGEKLDYELQYLPVGHIYDAPVEIWIVDGGKARALKADGRMFALGPLIGKGPEAAPYGFSGFRIHGPVTRSDALDEYVVFQGASYFRSMARGQTYGLSARGLAINTARTGGEEFPLFRGFWIEKPKAGAPEIIVQALLDSPSTTGVYRFSIQPGVATVMDVEVTLYPRKALAHVGLAPLTSMFMTGPANRRIPGDVRPAVHDSEGLVVLNGLGERIWRPLTNPKKLQASAFLDKDPKGFGLSQRDRSFGNFEDLEARYERRPTLWIEPKGGWGEGYVELIEIPVEDEIHNNIVVYWKPAKELEAGKAYSYAYRMHWAEAVPVAWSGARVSKTRVGNARKGDAKQFVVDFDGPAVKEIRELPIAVVSASAGTLANVTTQRHPDIGGLRVSFELNPAAAELVELRLALKANDQQISETWIYRWTKA
jgi:periplasmic glucans biosynthesis protein